MAPEESASRAGAQNTLTAWEALPARTVGTSATFARSGGTASESATIRAMGEGTASIAATHGSATGTLAVSVGTDAPRETVYLFHSDWGTSTGSSSAALRDTEKALPWDMARGEAGASILVVDAAGEGLDGWPTPNALKIVGIDDGNGRAKAASVSIDNGWPLPEVGQSLYYRYYLNVSSEFTVGSGPSDHPIETSLAGGSDNDWANNYQTAQGAFRTSLSAHSTEWPNHQWCIAASGGCRGSVIQLSPDVTYRLEFRVERVTSTNWRLEARVFDANGVLLFDNAAFQNVDGSASLADAPLLSFNNNPPRLGDLDFGTSAINPTEVAQAGLTFPFTMYRWGALAVCAGSWCGPYKNGR